MKNIKTLLITGGTGYIGSHAVVAFEEAGYRTVILDNLINSSSSVLDAIEKILGYRPIFFEGDMRDIDFLRNVFGKFSFDGVVHFAGLKAVGESTENPILYHENNIVGSIRLFEVMQEFGVKNILFSSSATVYRSDNIPPFHENMPLGTMNPYGTTKLVIEKILEDLADHDAWSACSLRYFNPIGAHSSGLIGESPNGIPNNLLPYVLDVAIGKRSEVSVYGGDYETRDGTGVRDYIDVCDLVDAHVLVYENLTRGYDVMNIGTGKGTSVLEMIDLVCDVTNKGIPYMITERRKGDLPTVYCSPEYVHKKLGWKSKRDIRESILNGWKFLQQQ